MKLAWGARVSPEFRRRIIEIAASGGFDPSALMACIAFETGRTFSPSIRNAAGSGATGLIQFMPSTAITLGTTVDDLARMTAEQQLDLVEKYFRPFFGRLKSLSDTYMAILRPSAIGKPDDFALITSDEGRTYAQNKGLDLDGDGNITKREATKYVVDALTEGMKPENAWEMDATAPIEDRSEGGIMADRQPDIGATLTGIASTVIGAINPIAGILFSAFGKKLAQQIENKAKLPGVGAEISKVIISASQQASGKSDPLEAVSVARQDPAMVAQIEQAVEARLDDLAPVLEQSVKWDKERWAAENLGRQVVSSIAIEEHKAGLWDMTRFLVVSLILMLWGVAWGLLAGILILAMRAEPNATMLMALIGLAGPIWTGAIVSTVVAVVAYRFDGTKASSEQSGALISKIEQR